MKRVGSFVLREIQLLDCNNIAFRNESLNKNPSKCIFPVTRLQKFERASRPKPATNKQNPYSIQ